MPIFTAIAAGATALATAVGFGAAAAASIGAFVVRTMVTIAISSLVANRANKSSAGASDVGARVQLGPATNNKLAVSYGSAFLAPTVTDAKITTDQKTMYYVFSLCEASSGTMSFGKIFWNGKEVTLGVGDYGANNKIISLTTNATPPQVDTTINGQAYIYGFINGSSSGVNTGGTSAITILSDAGIPVADRWTSTDTMTNTCFAVVKVIYNKDVQDAQQMPRLSVEVINTLTKPGAVFLDYMTNTVYGCAINVANIDTASLTALDVYSDQTITYIPVGGGSTTQPRYRIDGPVNTGDNCLANLQQLADACDSWLQYSELTGKWTIVMNKPYSGVIGDLYSVDSSVLIGGIDINPLDLNQTYNSLEVQYPNANINDQTDYKVVDLTTVGTAWYNPSLLSPNEPDNRLVVQYPQINNYIRAVYLGVRRLLQSREDLTIVCNLDYSGIQVVITAFEYNGSIYADNALLDFVPEANTGLSDPNIFDKPSTPIITNGAIANSAINYFTVSSNIPAVGSTLYMDFNYGNTSNVSTHKSYSSVQTGDGTLYTANSTVTINVADLNPGTYYWSSTARNDLAGRQSNSSASFNWVGPSVTPFDPAGNVGGITYDDMQPNGAGFLAYSNFDPRNGNLPILVTSTGVRNIPLIFPGTTISGTNVFPWYQGTGATSTGSWTPDADQVELVSPEGTNGWYKAIYVDLSGDNLLSTEIGQLWATLGFLGDVNNIQFQICRYAVFTGTSGLIQMQSRSLSTYFMGFKEPYPQHISINDWASGSSVYGSGISEWGYMIRNITLGSNLTMFHGTLSVKQQKLNP